MNKSFFSRLHALPLVNTSLWQRDRNVSVWTARGQGEVMWEHIYVLNEIQIIRCITLNMHTLSQAGESYLIRPALPPSALLCSPLSSPPLFSRQNGEKLNLRPENKIQIPWSYLAHTGLHCNLRQRNQDQLDKQKAGDSLSKETETTTEHRRPYVCHISLLTVVPSLV